MLNTKKVEFGGLQLELRLDRDAIFAIESKLDESLQGLFINGQGGLKLPPINKLLIVLHRANKVHGVTEKMMLEAFGKHLDSGKTTTDVMNIVQELLEEQNFFGKEDKPKEGEVVLTLDTPADEGIL